MFLENKIIWQKIPALDAFKSKLPEYSGVYVFMTADRVANIPFNLKTYYVGKTNNLKLRFGQHLDPWKSHNKDLFSMLNSKKKQKFEFWYSKISEDQIDALEKKLIKTLKPKYNIILRSNHDNK